MLFKQHPQKKFTPRDPIHMMRQKKLMLLGGIRYLLPVIEAAHKQGYYVITADYLPDNIAHKFSDKYVNVSIIDKEAVLKVAQAEQIDGIMSFGVDPGVVSASYVQNVMGLPSFGPFKSIEILQNKDLFRAYLTKHGFNAPWSYGFSTIEEAWLSRSRFQYPLIVKPTDSAGSKGCTRVDNESQLIAALEFAFKFSISGHIIVEQFLEKNGCTSDSDAYVEDGMLKFISFSAQRFDADAINPFTPAAYSWPSTFTNQEEVYLKHEIQRLITLLGIRTAVFNIETRVDLQGKPYIMELAPRGGGNRLCEMLRYATGVDMITAITRAVVGDKPDLIEQKPYQGHWAEIILHADKSGKFQDLVINDSFKGTVVETDLWVQPGDYCQGFKAANDAIGTLVLKFDIAEELEHALTHQSDWLKIIVH